MDGLVTSFVMFTFCVSRDYFVVCAHLRYIRICITTRLRRS